MARVQRAFMLGMALLFLVTSIGFSLLVVWQISQDNKKQNQSLQDQNRPDTGTQLKGTKLADFTPVAKVDVLQKTDLKEGSGEAAPASGVVTVQYTGALAKDGTIFESSLDSGQPATFSLDQVIKGWTEGIPGMKVGGKRRLLIPAAQAYGPSPPQGSAIPADADLVFDVELLKIGE